MKPVIIVLLLAGCAPAVTVRAPICEPPPLPPSAVAPCPMPAPIADGKLETLYLQSLVDTAQWGECIRKFNNLVALMAYRDKVCAQIKEEVTKPKAWWQF